MLKTLLILPKKWKTLEKRISNLETYLSRKDRLGSIYGQVKIEYKIMDLPTLLLTGGVFLEKDIKKITEPFRKDYHAVGVIFPYDKNSMYVGNYYPNTGTDYKLDFYVTTDENTKSSQDGHYFERFVEHELAGHAVSLDIGLGHGLSAPRSLHIPFVSGLDNTHHFFYTQNLEGYYKHINEVWKKKASLLSSMIEAYQKIVDSLKKKPEINDLLPKIKRDLVVIGARCAKKGYPFRLVEGYRSPERQTELFNQRPKVTNAKAGESLHQYGVALDIYPTKNGYRSSAIAWEIIAYEFKKLGYEWGGDFKNFIDKPHFELTLGYSLKDFINKKVNYSLWD